MRSMLRGFAGPRPEPDLAIDLRARYRPGRQALAASPLAPSPAALPAATQDALNAAIGACLAPLLSEGKIRADMTSNIAVGLRWPCQSISCPLRRAFC
jgi:hypothetical protein